MDNRRQSGLWQQDASGYYERQQPPQGPYSYYQPPPRKSADNGRRSFSERSGSIPGYGEPFSSSNAPMRQDSRKVRDLTRAASERVTQPPNDPNSVPDNVRAKPWSPDPAMEKPRQASNASQPMRRGSVPDRSPLQKLEMTAKEEKRARLEQAEHRSRQNSVNRGKPMATEGDMLRAGSMRANNARVASDGSRMPRDGGYYYKSSPRQMPADQFQQASDALRYKRAPQQASQDPYMQKQRSTQPQIAQNPQPYHHAPDAPRSMSRSQYPNNSVQRSASDGQGSGMPQRTASGKYKHRLRDAGYAGAGAAAAGAAGFGAYEAGSTDHGQQAHDGSRGAEASPVSPVSQDNGDLQRNGSRRLQKRLPADLDPKRGKQSLQTDRMGSMGSKKERRVAEEYLEPDPLPKEQVANGPDSPVSYKVPPQTAAAQQAHAFVNETDQGRQQRGLGQEAHGPQGQEKHHRFGDMFHHHSQSQRGYVPSSKPLDEWRNAQTARLTASDLEFEQEVSAGARDRRNEPWWEKERSRRTSSSGRSGQPPQMDGPYEEEAKQFRPMVFLKCGPLLRYTGIRREGAKEIWRGSAMIVTEDAQSDYSSIPTLRLFAQPADLHQPPPRELLESGQDVPPEYDDPVAGQVKTSRTGRPLYVKPAHDLTGGVDLSTTENNQGIYSAMRAPTLGSQYSSEPDGRQTEHMSFQHKSRIKRKDGERAGRYKDIKAARLHTERGFTFWRWNIEIELGETQYRVAYRINRGPALGFWVPARGETMHIMFHSCNGFSLSVNPNEFSGPDPLWRSVLNRHQARPFHVMLGGGDQIYNDAAMRDTELFKEWLQMKNPHEKHGAEFSPEMQDELEEFYLHRYSMWFSQGMFAMAGSQIPMVNIWDDHDIIDGFGSYPHHFMSTPVFTGLGAVAFKYYMLFQHQSLVGETEKEEPSWVLGASPGPYIAELSRSVFLSLGRRVAFLGVDCRTERMRDEILSEQTYDILFERCQDEIAKGEVKHLIVLLGVPIAYPRLNFLENILTSKVMDPIKAIGRTGMLGGFVNKFDGGVEILDDLDDHWTAKHHKQERNWFIQELQDLAASKSVRVTILGGDVHLGAVGQFYTPKKFGVQKDRDHRYMPNIVSSAIVNTPPPPMMADVLNKRNKIHHLDDETDEDLIPMFEADVDGSKRNNKCLLPRRNYCTIREFHPGSTPPPTPPPERRSFDQGDDERQFNGPEERDRRFPPGSMRRTMSLTRGPGSLMRRLSGSRRSKNPPPSMQRTGSYGVSDERDERFGSGSGRSQSLSGPRPQSAATGRDSDAEPPRPGFLRRPTLLTKKDIRNAAAKGGAPDEEEGEVDGDAPDTFGHINLEGGLDICLNMEIDQRDPGGATIPYRMLVPALWYDGAADPNTERFKSRGATLMDRLRGRGRGRKGSVDSYGTGSRSPTPSPPRQQGGAPASGGIAPAGGPGWTPTATGGVRMPAQQQQKQGYYGQGMDGARDAPSSAMAGRRSMDQAPPSSSAYDRGFQGSKPPIGGSSSVPSSSQNHATFAQQQQQQQQQPPPPPQSGGGRSGGGGGGFFSSRRASSAPKHTQFTTGGARDDDAGYSEDSLTPSDEYYEPGEEGPGRAPRRFSKAEKFFGIGGAEDVQQQGRFGGGGGGGGEERGKKRWQIWK